jgi:decaprenyl-phosphate phosphoribosyltransferase
MPRRWWHPAVPLLILDSSINPNPRVPSGHGRMERHFRTRLGLVMPQSNEPTSQSGAVRNDEAGASDSGPTERGGFAAYLAISRPDHWFKNVLILPGTVVAVFASGTGLAAFWPDLLLGIASLCCIASANYVVNEWLDAPFDRFHPLKRDRPSVSMLLDGRLVWALYGLWTVLGFAFAAAVSSAAVIPAVALWGQGIAYNVSPLRTKDVPYLDVLSESINNPIRLLMGWVVVVDAYWPPWSLVLAYWMLGAFLMALKRYAEFRFIGSSEIAGLYRRSFRSYSESSLLVSSLIYAFLSAFCMGVFVVQYRLELIFAVPFLAVGFAWYLQIGLKTASAAQRPERLYEERGFVIYAAVAGLVTIACFVVDLPWLPELLRSAAPAL